MFSIRALAMGALSVLAQGQVVLKPRVATLLPGQACAFRVRMASGVPLRELGSSRFGQGPSLRPAAWVWTILDGGPGTLDELTGVYLAPSLAKPCTVTVRAAYRPRPEITAQASLLVLPFEPFDVVRQVLGPGWVEPFTSELPFMDHGTGVRYHSQSQVKVIPREATQPLLKGVLYAGYGVPFTLRWQPVPGAEAQLLSYWEGDDLIRKCVTGRSSQGLACTNRVRAFAVESLQAVPGLEDTWLSHSQELLVHLRGLVPYAGNALTEPGHADGVGLGARFTEPFGLAMIGVKQEPHRTSYGCLVTDPAQHVVRMVSVTGAVTTPWGQPGLAGHQDARPSRLRRLAKAFGLEGCLEPDPRVSLFNRPTFLCPSPSRDQNPLWKRCLVADSGNHAIRALAPDGAVTTLAGRPGEAGYRDAWTGGEALFSNPQGLAEARDGQVYVADQGNGVIRCLTRSGQVFTLAGSPGCFGSQDGVRSGARFTQLKGLAMGGPEHPSTLFAVDGHAIRAISLPEGRVTTVLGVVATPGAKDIKGGRSADRRAALSGPCLNQPCGIQTSRQGLKIADLGNHSVRDWSAPKASLVTLVGEPGLGETRWGLVRGDLEGPLDERFATVDAPKTLASREDDPGTLIVATGNCLGTLRYHMAFRDQLSPVALACSPGTLAEDCVATFAVQARNGAGFQTLRTIHFTVDFLEADGTLAARVRGTGDTLRYMSARACFSQRGTASVVVRCVSEQGAAIGTRMKVVIP